MTNKNIKESMMIKEKKTQPTKFRRAQKITRNLVDDGLILPGGAGLLNQEFVPLQDAGSVLLQSRHPQPEQLPAPSQRKKKKIC